ASYAWDFNYDGANFGVDATGATPTLSAAALDGPSSWTLALRVTDTAGNSATASPSLSVTNVSPVAGIQTWASSVNEGSSGASISLTGLSDPSAADTAAGFKFSYDFDNNGV